MSQVQYVHEGHPQVAVSGGRFNEFMFRFWARSPRWAAPLAVLVCFSGGVASQNSLVTYHGRYASCMSSP